jgi:inositol oxygenase
LDTSELLRPEPSPHGGDLDKPVSKFRDYTIDTSDPLKERVRRTYHEMHANMTVDFVRSRVSQR